MKLVHILTDSSVANISGIGASTSLFAGVVFARNENWHDAFVCLCVSSLVMIPFLITLGFEIGNKYIRNHHKDEE